MISLLGDKLLKALARLAVEPVQTATYPTSILPFLVKSVGALFDNRAP